MRSSQSFEKIQKKKGFFTPAPNKIKKNDEKPDSIGGHAGDTSVACNFFVSGHCLHGKDCKFDHLVTIQKVIRAPSVKEDGPPVPFSSVVFDPRSEYYFAAAYDKILSISRKKADGEANVAQLSSTVNKKYNCYIAELAIKSSELYAAFITPPGHLPHMNDVSYTDLPNKILGTYGQPVQFRIDRYQPKDGIIDSYYLLQNTNVPGGIRYAGYGSGDVGIRRNTGGVSQHVGFLSTKNKHRTSVTSITSYEKYLFTGSEDYGVHVWDIKDPYDPSFITALYPEIPENFEFSYRRNCPGYVDPFFVVNVHVVEIDGQAYLIVGYKSSAIKMWSINKKTDSFEEIRTAGSYLEPNKDFSHKSVYLSCFELIYVKPWDTQLLLSCYSNGSIVIRVVSTKSLHRPFTKIYGTSEFNKGKCHKSPIVQVAHDSDSTFCSVDTDGVALLWKIITE